MIFYHYNDVRINDLIKYKELIIEMANSYMNRFGSEGILKTWQENDKIKQILQKFYQRQFSFNNDDYELIIDFGAGRNPENHYFILFPKNPNSFEVISVLHARGLIGLRGKYEEKDWLHDWLLKFIKYFPKTFMLYVWIW